MELGYRNLGNFSFQHISLTSRINHYNAMKMLSMKLNFYSEIVSKSQNPEKFSTQHPEF